jgi:hypothetical protein
VADKISHWARISAFCSSYPRLRVLSAFSDAGRSSLPFFRTIFWQSKVNNQPFPLIVTVGAFHTLLGELLPGLSHLLQFLALIERSRPRHIAAFGGIATEFFDSFQGNSF